MPLIPIWNSNPETVSQMSVEQIVMTAGNGRLLDDSECSSELRKYLSQVSSEKLGEYADYCLTNKFDSNGKVLQDVVNELGRRLDYKTENGRYQGSSNRIGNDGLWLSPEGHSVVIEVKTTDAYSISVDTIAQYRTSLGESQMLTEQSSMLLVVGRYDTGQLEAQVRGSRYAWDMRLISVDSLINLVRLKESTEDRETSRKIREILVPMEYTRLDRLIDVMFTTAKDVEAVIEQESPSEEGDGDPATHHPKGTWVFTDQETINNTRTELLKALSAREHTALIRKSPSLYRDSEGRVAAACTVSKKYDKGELDYWYAYHDHWDEFLRGAETGIFLLGCVGLNRGFAVPYEIIHNKLPELNLTARRGRQYWHVKIKERGGNFYILAPSTGKQLDLSPYTIMINESAPAA